MSDRGFVVTCPAVGIAAAVVSVPGVRVVWGVGFGTVAGSISSVSGVVVTGRTPADGWCCIRPDSVVGIAAASVLCWVRWPVRPFVCGLWVSSVVTL